MGGGKGRKPTIMSIQETNHSTLSKANILRYMAIGASAKTFRGDRGILLAVRGDSGFTLSEDEIEDWFVVE